MRVKPRAFWAVLETQYRAYRAVDPHSLFADPHSLFADPYPDPAVFLNADPDPAAFKMWIRIRIQLKPIKKITLWRVFFSCKKHKRMLKSKKQCSLFKITWTIWIKLAVITNILPFFQFFCKNYFPPWPGSGSRRENKCGSGSTTLARICCHQKWDLTC